MATVGPLSDQHLTSASDSRPDELFERPLYHVTVLRTNSDRRTNGRRGPDQHKERSVVIHDISDRSVDSGAELRSLGHRHVPRARPACRTESSIQSLSYVAPTEFQRKIRPEPASRHGLRFVWDSNNGAVTSQELADGVGRQPVAACGLPLQSTARSHQSGQCRLTCEASIAHCTPHSRSEHSARRGGAVLRKKGPPVELMLFLFHTRITRKTECSSHSADLIALTEQK